MFVFCYLLNAQINVVQGFVQRFVCALGGGDGALRALLLHVCEQTLNVGVCSAALTVLAGHKAVQLLFHAPLFPGWHVQLSLVPIQSSVQKLYCVVEVFHFDQNRLPVVQQVEPL